MSGRLHIVVSKYSEFRTTYETLDESLIDDPYRLEREAVVIKNERYDFMKPGVIRVEQMVDEHAESWEVDDD